MQSYVDSDTLQIVKLERVDSVNIYMRDMSDAQMHNKMDILSLPKGVLSNIGSWLDDKEACKMELASKIFYNALSKSCGPSRTRLNLGVPGGPDKNEAPPTEAPSRLELSGRPLTSQFTLSFQCMYRGGEGFDLSS